MSQRYELTRISDRHDLLRLGCRSRHWLIPHPLRVSKIPATAQRLIELNNHYATVGFRNSQGILGGEQAVAAVEGPRNNWPSRHCNGAARYGLPPCSSARLAVDRCGWHHTWSGKSGRLRRPETRLKRICSYCSLVSSQKGDGLELCGFELPRPEQRPVILAAALQVVAFPEARCLLAGQCPDRRMWLGQSEESSWQWQRRPGHSRRDLLLGAHDIRSPLSSAEGRPDGHRAGVTSSSSFVVVAMPVGILAQQHADLVLF